jgi:hypothetical protein
MTMNAELEKIESLLPDFQYVDRDNDRIIITVGFVASFYYWSGHTPAKRMALVECFEAYEAAYGSELKWGCDPESWAPINLKKKAFPSLREYVKPLDEDDGIQWYVSSGDDPDAAGEYVACCMTEQAWMKDEMSCFQFRVPRSLVFDNEQWKPLEHILLLCIERLAPFHGSAGFATVTPEQATSYEPEELELATRYRGLWVGDMIGDSAQAQNGPKSVNWLTFVSDILTERLGGPKAFAAYCQRFGVEPTRSTNGFVLRAGDTPQLGPVSEQPPEAYVRANAAIRPLRNGKHGSMGSGSIDGELRFNRCTSDLWIRRFDGPDIWPPLSFAGLPPGPVGIKPTKKIKLDTGKPCAVHGRYRKYPIDPALFNQDEEYDRSPMVILLPGDIAPFYLTLGPHGEFVSREIATWELVAEL